MFLTKYNIPTYRLFECQITKSVLKLMYNII